VDTDVGVAARASLNTDVGTDVAVATFSCPATSADPAPPNDNSDVDESVEIEDNFGPPLQPRHGWQAPTPWTITVINTECPEVDNVAAVDGIVLKLSVPKESHDVLVRAMVNSILEARAACYRIRPAVAPADFGNRALLADGFVADHGISRYQAALETALQMSANRQ